MNEMNLAASSAFVGRVPLLSDDAIAIEQLSESIQRFASYVEHSHPAGYRPSHPI
jgi:hypothetical protein